MSILSLLSLRFQVGPKEWQRWQFALVSRVPRGKMGKAPAKLPLSVLQRRQFSLNWLLLLCRTALYLPNLRGIDYVKNIHHLTAVH